MHRLQPLLHNATVKHKEDGKYRKVYITIGKTIEK